MIIGMLIFPDMTQLDIRFRSITCQLCELASS
jgi:hypothetical protein